MSLEDKIIDAVADADPFPVKPGGLIDTHRRAEAARNAAEAQQRNAAEDISNRAYKAVKVADEMPEAGSARTVIMSSARGVQQLLGADMLRRRAVILTLDEPVVIAADLAAASDSNNALAATAAVNASGFVLPVNTPLVLESRHEWWAVPTSDTATRVSVLTETYAAAG